MTTNQKKSKFFKAIGYEPQDYQRAVHDSDARFRVVSAGVRSGKSWLSAPEALFYAMSKSGVMVWVVAPTYELTEEIRMRIKAYIDNKLSWVDAGFDRLKKTQYLKNASVIQYKSTKHEKSLKSKGVHFMVVDEGKDVGNRIWEYYLESRLVSTKGDALIITEPIDSSDCWVLPMYEKGLNGEKGYASFHWNTTDNRTIDAREVERAKNALPERIFNSKFIGGTHKQEGKLFVGYRMEGGFGGYDPKHKYIAGLDIGQKSSYTVLTILDLSTRRIEFIDRFRQFSWDYIEKRIKSGLLAWGNPLCNTDSAGVGSRVFPGLVSMGLNVKDGIINKLARRNTLIEDAALLLERQEIILPDYEPLKVELDAMTFGYTKNGFPIYRPPSGITDDIVMSLGLCLEMLPASGSGGGEKMMKVSGQRDIVVPTIQQRRGSLLDDLFV